MSEQNEKKNIGFSELAKLYGMSESSAVAQSDSEETQPVSVDTDLQPATIDSHIGEIALVDTESETQSEPEDADVHNPPARPPKKPPSVWRELGMLVVKIVAILLVIAVIVTFFYGIYRVEDNAMNPMVREGDLIIFDRRNRDFRVGDLIVFEIEGQRQVRRIVAREGDAVDITDRGLIVNGSIIQEHDIFFDTTQFEGGIQFPVHLAPGQVFVLGDSRSDNRVTVTDSRMYGAIYTDNALGSVFSIIRRRKF